MIIGIEFKLLKDNTLKRNDIKRHKTKGAKSIKIISKNSTNSLNDKITPFKDVNVLQ
jgi:hypothetical protein